MKKGESVVTMLLFNSRTRANEHRNANHRTIIRNLISFSYFIGEVGDFAWQGRQLYVSLVSCLYEFYLVFFLFLLIYFSQVF